MIVTADQLRAWRTVLESAEDDAILATSKEARRALHFKLGRLASQMHDTELALSLAENRDQKPQETR